MRTRTRVVSRDGDLRLVNVGLLAVGNVVFDEVSDGTQIGINLVYFLLEDYRLLR